MSVWKRLTLLERRIEAHETFPPSLRKDSKELDLRSVWIERYELGVHKPSDKQLSKIREVGYDHFVVDLMNSKNKIGGTKYLKLCEMGKVDLTFEYIVFHNLRDRLIPENRTMIARLLAHKITT